VIEACGATSTNIWYYQTFGFTLAASHTVIRWDAHGTNGLTYLIED
jgi:hypothetical protein